MFTGTVESRSHEGGLLIHFEGSSPALDAIMVRADDGVYVGKVDGVLGSTDRPLAHVAHIDRSLDMDELIGVQLKIRAKVQREQRNDRRSGRDERPQRRFDNDRRDGRDNRSGGRYDNDRRGGRDNRSGGGRYDNDRRGGRDNRSRGRYDNDRRGGRDNRSGGRFDNQRSGNQRQFNNDWTCPKCNNSNFAFREACNRCEAPRPSGGGQRRSNERYGNDRRGGRDNRSGGRYGNDRRDGRDNRSGGRYDNDRRGGRQQRDTFNNNDWTCPKCNNSNFSFRDVCNRCEAPRPGGGGRGGRQNSSGGYRKSGQNGGFGERGGGGRDNRGQSGGRSRQDRNNNDRTYRKARGKRSGHAHNQPPRDFRTPRKFERKDD